MSAEADCVLLQVTMVTLLAKKAFKYNNKAFLVKMVVKCCRPLWRSFEIVSSRATRSLRLICVRIVRLVGPKNKQEAGGGLQRCASLAINHLVFKETFGLLNLWRCSIVTGHGHTAVPDPDASAAGEAAQSSEQKTDNPVVASRPVPDEL